MSDFIKLSKEITAIHISADLSNMDCSPLLCQEFSHYLGLNYSTQDELIKDLKIKSTLEEYDYFLLVVDDNLIGLIYIYGVRLKYHRCCIGLGILDDYRGKGYAINALLGFLEYLKSIGFVRIAIEIEPDNVKSDALIKKYFIKNFHYEGTLANNYGLGCHSKVYAVQVE